MIDDIERLAADGTRRAATAATLDEVRVAETELLGKRSALAALKRRVGELDDTGRPDAGRALNQARDQVQAALATRRAELEAPHHQARIEGERLDLSEVRPGRRGGRHHLVTQTISRLEDLFVGLGFVVAEGPEVEDEWHNFGALNFPVGHPSRDMYDTLYVDHGEPGSTLLRTHTSPVQVRLMESQAPPIYAVMPGRTFRRDTADATHMPVFHQIEGLVIDRDITFAHLAGTIEAFTKAYFGGSFGSRLRPSYFPFTEPSAEFDIRRPDGTWLELGGCGMVHPNVLTNCGLDAEEWQGFAFGFGVERLAMMAYGVEDLRDLFTNDIRFLRQF